MKYEIRNMKNGKDKANVVNCLTHIPYSIFHISRPKGAF